LSNLDVPRNANTIDYDYSVPLERPTWRFGVSDSDSGMNRPDYDESSLKRSVEPLKGKLALAVDYLTKNNGELMLSGRQLQDSVVLNGTSISYRYWNDAKKIVNRE